MAAKNKITTSDYLPYGEYQKLVKCLHADKKYVWELYACASFCTALRGSDVLSLRWNMILNKKSLVITEGKTKKIRNIRIGESSKNKFNELYELLGSPRLDSFCFSGDGKKAFSIQYINRTLKDFRVRYQLPIDRFSTHTFRKTFGRYIYESMGKSAESLILLNQIFRHSSMEITQIYIGIRKDEIDSLFDSIEF